MGTCEDCGSVVNDDCSLCWECRGWAVGAFAESEGEVPAESAPEADDEDEDECACGAESSVIYGGVPYCDDCLPDSFDGYSADEE